MAAAPSTYIRRTILSTRPAMTLSRRRFLGSAAAITAGFAGLRCTSGEIPADPMGVGYGPLLDDPGGLLALPRGFRYTIVSRWGERMDDGLLVPALHDGMATFPGPDGRTLLVRNHEVNSNAEAEQGAFGPRNELLTAELRDRLYDAGSGGAPALGGTTTLLFDTERQALVSHHLSVAGTLRNCAGGPTPWGTWITCEETLERAGGGRARDHGYVFEVPADLDGLARAVPLTAMGRFNHEAVAVDPASGVVYETEDDGEGLFYRFLPDAPGELARGGRLQALAFRDQPSLDTRNWDGDGMPVGATFAVEWIDLEAIDAPDGDLNQRGHAAGAARFARGEGIWYGNDAVYFACTNGGRARKGQIFRYTPSPFEGTPREAEQPGVLELFVEPNDGTLVENADNLTVSPWGDLVVCEDGTGDDYLVGITPSGEIYHLAHNLTGDGEFAGACFSPDGGTFFVNMQSQGYTFAITGPWHTHQRG